MKNMSWMWWLLQWYNQIWKNTRNKVMSTLHVQMSKYFRRNKISTKPVPLASISFQLAYFNPNPRKCCPIKRIISISDLDIVFWGDCLPPDSPFSDPSLVPFCCETDGVSTVSPLCCGVVPLVCILTQVLSFFRGGGVAPPLSESDEDASMSAQGCKVGVCLDG